MATFFRAKPSSDAGRRFRVEKIMNCAGLNSFKIHRTPSGMAENDLDSPTSNTLLTEHSETSMPDPMMSDFKVLLLSLLIGVPNIFLMLSIGEFGLYDISCHIVKILEVCILLFLVHGVYRFMQPDKGEIIEEIAERLDEDEREMIAHFKTVLGDKQSIENTLGDIPLEFVPNDKQKIIDKLTVEAPMKLAIAAKPERNPEIQIALFRGENQHFESSDTTDASSSSSSSSESDCEDKERMDLETTPSQHDVTGDQSPHLPLPYMGSSAPPEVCSSDASQPLPSKEDRRVTRPSLPQPEASVLVTGRELGLTKKSIPRVFPATPNPADNSLCQDSYLPPKLECHNQGGSTRVGISHSIAAQEQVAGRYCNSTSCSEIVVLNRRYGRYTESKVQMKHEQHLVGSVSTCSTTLFHDIVGPDCIACGSVVEINTRHSTPSQGTHTPLPRLAITRMDCWSQVVIVQRNLYSLVVLARFRLFRVYHQLQYPHAYGRRIRVIYGVLCDIVNKAWHIRYQFQCSQLQVRRIRLLLQHSANYWSASECAQRLFHLEQSISRHVYHSLICLQVQIEHMNDRLIMLLARIKTDNVIASVLSSHPVHPFSYQPAMIDTPVIGPGNIIAFQAQAEKNLFGSQ